MTVADLYAEFLKDKLELILYWHFNPIPWYMILGLVWKNENNAQIFGISLLWEHLYLLISIPKRKIKITNPAAYRNPIRA
jgi:hypothetical protein